MGLPNDKHSGTPAVVQKHYGHLRTAALSLAGVLLYLADILIVSSESERRSCKCCKEHTQHDSCNAVHLHILCSVSSCF